MCEFVSWLEHKGKILFLTDKEMKSRRGKELIAHTVDKTDLVGHGSILWFYDLKRAKTTQRECEDFSSPDNFPREIAEAIKSGQMIFFNVCPEGLLSGPAWEQYKAIRGPAWEQYKAINGQALEQYKAILGPALEQYNAINGPALEQYKAIRGPALEQYEAILGPAWEQYKAINGPALEQYNAINGQALEQYKAIRGQAFWKLFADTGNRAEAWI